MCFVLLFTFLSFSSLVALLPLWTNNEKNNVGKILEVLFTVQVTPSWQIQFQRSYVIIIIVIGIIVAGTDGTKMKSLLHSVFDLLWDEREKDKIEADKSPSVQSSRKLKENFSRRLLNTYTCTWSNIIFALSIDRTEIRSENHLFRRPMHIRNENDWSFLSECETRDTCHAAQQSTHNDGRVRRLKWRWWKVTYIFSGWMMSEIIIHNWVTSRIAFIWLSIFSHLEHIHFCLLSTR